MHIKSRLPDLPPIPDANIFDLLFTSSSSQGAQIPDYTVYIDAATGLRHSLRQPLQVQLANALLAITTPFANSSTYATVYELTHALRTAKPKVLFVRPALLPIALAAAKEVGLSETQIYILEGTSSDGRLSSQGLANRVRKGSIAREPIRPAKKNTLTYLVSSSRTSGLPKGGLLSWLPMETFGRRCSWELYGSKGGKFLQLTSPKEPPIALCFLPLYHAYSLNVVAFRMFSIVPLTYVIMDKWNTSAVLKAISKYHVNILALVPSAMHQLLNHLEFTKTDFSSVISTSCGVAHLPTTLRDKFFSRFNNGTLWEGYGTSEVTLGISRKTINGLFGFKVRTIREDGSEADVDEPGELWVKAPVVALGYYRNENATREAFVDGWLRTGDWMHIDKNEFLHFVERKKDTFKVEGAQVSPSEIENVLHAQPDGLIIDACVGGVSRGRTSDEKVPRAWIVLSDEGKQRGAEETVKVLETRTKENLSPYKWLRGGFEVADVIPKTPTGKILRRLLQEKFEAQYVARAKL
ncbi:uncharacterized protein PHACADRAFT_199609 [Phanerochaete carnosa HHB-10118-sp]|uniref:AMP-dependent synthetase/ligase domain-containing protein n=1 Tax=Phanerochaete carnosa (strain HHB-10118-sp) TaxID=650164 RepID=K5VL22_PHACS|nr:uncharacterized protein PHACADRAFT_199609 [Phanerochaete carnosa HHB-10118-sp]EKM52113.1 hypothetical protein PHACADRAFT_199609 [Phanerochaete carnosa HHB-10118-sp]